MTRPPTLSNLLVKLLARVWFAREIALAHLRDSGTAVRTLCLVLLLVLCHVPGVSAQQGSVNVALAANGGVASASSTYVLNGYSFPVSAVNDGDRTGLNWGHGGGWNSATANVFPDWVQINFNGQQTIDQVIVYTLQDNYTSPVDPSDTLTFTLYGVTDFQVQGWNGTAWVNLGAAVTGNNLVKRAVSFPAFTTNSIRVNVTAALASYARIVEVEAWAASLNLPPAVSITTPANNAAFAAPATIPITATATDVDAALNKVEFYQSASLLGTVTTGGAGNSGSNYSFTWANVAAGSYALTAKAYDIAGATATSSAVNVAVAQPGAPLPTAWKSFAPRTVSGGGSSMLSVMLNPKLLYVANRGDNTVEVLGSPSNVALATIPVGTSPYYTAVSADATRVYVTNYGSNSVSVLDTASNAVIATIPVGTQPTGVAVSPTSNVAYVTNYGTRRYRCSTPQPIA